jgi:hypothetical protein
VPRDGGGPIRATGADEPARLLPAE